MKRNRKLEKAKEYILSNKGKLIPYIIVLTILLLSVGYSAFSSNLNITGFIADVRIKKDIRVTGVNEIPIVSLGEFCTLVNDTDGSGTISVGDKYSCDPGDGVYRTFYVLEDGDNTTLIDGITGTTSAGDVSLIMDSNLDEKTTWCLSGEYDGETCKADGVYTTIANNTTGWTNVEVTAPTAYQIAAAGGNLTWPDTYETEIPSWLVGDYWTSTDGMYSINTDNGPGYDFAFLGGVYADDVINSHGVRPVITVSKGSIGVTDSKTTYTEYNVSNVSAGINLPNKDSSVILNIEVTNIGNAEAAIANITGLPSNLTYELIDYDLNEKICDSNDKCTLGVKKQFKIKIKYVSGGYNSSKTFYDIRLDFDFQQFYKITYTDIDIPNYVCTLVTDTDNSGTITIGDKYSCDPGDGVYRTFYVLEDGDETTLIDGTTGTTSAGEVSLIMDSNLDAKTTWCLSGEYGGETCKADGVYTTIANNTTGWINVEVTAPTAYQVAQVVGDLEWDKSGAGLNTTIPSWLGSTNQYWTSTNAEGGAGSSFAWTVFSTTLGLPDVIETHYVRPVITIPKTNMGLSNIELPTEVMGSATLTVDFSNLALDYVSVKVDGVKVYNYTYKDGILTIPDVSGNVEISNGLETYSGTYITLNNQDIVNYKIYGNSTQNGIPTLESPIEVESVGEKTINLFSKDNFTDNKALINGSLYDRTDRFVSDYINCIDISSVSINFAASFAWYDENKNLISYENKSSTIFRNYVKPDGAVYLRLDFDKSIVSPEEVMCVGGEYSVDTMPQYEPYGKYKIPVKVTNGTEEVTTNVFLNEPLRKVGDSADYIDYSQQKIIRNIKKMVFTGEEGFVDFDENVFTTVTIEKGLKSSNDTLMSNLCIPVRGTTIGWRNNNVNSLQIQKSWIGATTVTELQNKLTVLNALGTPLKMYYVLATPTEETIELPEISTLSGTTNITAGNTTIEITAKDKLN
ncbi:MAG: hypothetical protein IKL65_06425 [Bacilli bacterium]|nr:hypothetical protein [Bacilli bacterium]